MNKTLIDFYVKSLSIVKKNKVWKEFLLEHGITTTNISSDLHHEIINKAFKEMFASGQKDNRIRLENISKTYENGFKAVDDFNLTIEPNDFVCLLGPSGCGKTTALRMMAGLDQITGGKYFIGNREMNSVHPSERKTAMVFQNYALYPFMTVYNNIAFGLKLKTFKNDSYLAKVEEFARLKEKNYQEIADLKFEIKLLNKPKKDEINEVLIKIKKAKIKNDWVAFDSLNKELDILKNEAAKLKETAPARIEKIKAKIKSLQEEQKLFYNEQKSLNDKRNEEIDKKIASLKEESKRYYESHLDMIPKLKEDQRNIKKDIKEIFDKNNIKLVEKLKEFDVVKKAGGKDVESHLEKIEKEINEIQKQFDEKIKTLVFEQGKIKQELIMVKNSNVFKIQELEAKKTSSNKLINDAVKLSVIWKKSIPSRVHGFAKIVGLTNFLKRKPAALSGGQRQRIALIRAISKNAQLFLFDEPLSNLDAKLRGSMRTEIKRIHESVGATSLYVTHDQIEAMTMANKVVVMNVGYIQQVGQPKDLYDNPANLFVARFIGTPTINTLVGKLNGQSINFGQVKVDLDLPKAKAENLAKAKSSEVILGARAQDITLKPIDKPTKTGVHGTVDMVELIGSEYVITVRSNIGTVKAIVPNSLVLMKDQLVSVSIDTKKSHVFDLKTGFALTSVINAETKAAQKVWYAGVQERIDNKKLLERESKEKNKAIPAIINLVKSSTKEGKNKNIRGKISKKTKKYTDYSLVELDSDNMKISS